MTKRREQLTVSPAKFEEDVYEYLEQLSKKRQLSGKLHEWAKQDLHGNGNQNIEDSQHILEEIRDLRQEFRELRQLLIAGKMNLRPSVAESFEPEQPMMLVSSDRANHILDDEDVNYNY